MELLTWQQHKRTDDQQPLSGRVGMTRNVAAMLLGSRLLNKMLRHRNITLSGMPQALLEQLLIRHNATTLKDLYEDVGTGKLPASTVLSYLLDKVGTARDQQKMI